LWFLNDSSSSFAQNLTVEWHEWLPLHARSRHPQSHTQPRLLRPYSLALARTGRVRDAIEALRAVLASSPPELPPSERDPEPAPGPETAAASASAGAEESKTKGDSGASSSSDGSKPAAMDTTADDDAGAATAGSGSGSESKQSADEVTKAEAFSVPAAGELRLLEVAHHKVVRVLHPDFPLAKLQTSLGGEWGALRAERIPREELQGLSEGGLGFTPAYELAGAPAAAAAPSDSKSAGGSGGGETKSGPASAQGQALGRVVPLVHFARDAEASPTGPVTTSRMRCFGTPLLVPVAARDTAATLALRLQQLLGVPRAEWEHKDRDKEAGQGQGWRLYVCSHGYARPCKEGEALLEAHAFKGKDFLALEHRESNARTMLHAASASAGGPGGAQGRRKRPEKALFIKE
jgi:hypothetical protein